MDTRLRISALLTASTLALTFAACGEDDTSAEDPTPAGGTSTASASSSPSGDASPIDPSGGEGFGPTEDSKTITVE
jgi:hypothetical protein